MPPIPRTYESFEDISESISSPVERSVAKAAGGVLGFIAGNIPGAVIGYNLGDVLYTYRGQPVKVLTELGKAGKVPLLPENLGIGLEPSAGRLIDTGYEWGRYFVEPEVQVENVVEVPGAFGSMSFRGRTYNMRKKRKRRFKRKFKYNKRLF